MPGLSNEANDLGCDPEIWSADSQVAFSWGNMQEETAISGKVHIFFMQAGQDPECEIIFPPCVYLNLQKMVDTIFIMKTIMLYKVLK